jgi:acyl-coenzyme A thioesterase PaaI-like protein
MCSNSKIPVRTGDDLRSHGFGQGPACELLVCRLMPYPQLAPRWPPLAQIAHPHCVACSPDNPSGLRLEFEDAGGGVVRATFDCGAAFEGYPGQLHGGIISMLLDAAMANCLFAQDQKAVTAELSVKFKAAVVLNHRAITEARVARDLFPLFLMEASLTQDGEIKATATAKFIVTQGL